MLYRLDLVGHLKKWAIQLSEFEVSFDARKALKAQFFVDFLVEMTYMSLELDHT